MEFLTETKLPHHMGQMINKAVKERKMLISDFAKAIHCSRTNIYSIFKRQSIDIERLKQIADVLKLDVLDFITAGKENSHKCIAVIEINSENLERLLNKQDLICLKSWRMNEGLINTHEVQSLAV